MKLSSFVLALVLPAVAFALTPASLSLTVSPAPSYLGKAVALTAAVTSGATGKVTFYDGATILGIAPVTGGEATLSVISLPSGARQLRAHYSGDATYAAGNSTLVPLTVLAGASPGFHRPAYVSAGSHAVSVATADFNGDGHSDFVVADGDSNVVRIFLGDGTGSFRAAGAYTTPSTARCVTVADFNGDGRADLAVANQYSSNVSILLGNGDGTFQTALNYPAGSTPYALSVGDFDGDGLADLVVVNNGGSSVSILLGKGDGTFQPAVNYPVRSYPVSVAVADFNRDGRPDIAVAGADAVSILLGRGDGSFSAAVDYPTGSRNSAVAADDFNGDGAPDIAVTGFDGLSVLIGNGDGAFAPAARSSFYSNLLSAVVGDFDGDGHSDLAAFDSSVNAVAVFRGNGDGTFQQAVNYPAESDRGALAIGDFNADGKADLIVGGAGIGVLLGGAAPNLAIAVKRGSGFIQGQAGAFYTVTVSNLGDIAATGPVSLALTLPPGLIPTSLSGAGWTCVPSALTCARSDSLPAGASYPVITASVNIAGNFSGSAIVSFNLSGDGSRRQAVDTVVIQHSTVTSLAAPPRRHASTMPANGLLPSTSYPIGAEPNWVGVGDFNGDGIPDIVTANGDYNPNVNVTVLPGAGDGTFRSPVVSSSTASNPNWGVVADFNGDGKLDVAVAAANGLTILRGNGDGTFQSSMAWSSTNGCYSLVAADFNRDGVLDLASISNGTVIVFIGNGNGTFRPPQSVSGGIQYSLVQLGDMNGDGLPDLVALTTGYPATVNVFLSTGAGTFLAPVSGPPVNTYPMSFAVGDFNGDGRMDVALTDTSTVRLMLGKGDGTLAAPISSSLSATPGSRALAGDFDGDGKLDLAYANYSFPGVTLVFGNGNGTFSLSVTLPTDSAAFNVVQADFNGDGRPDFAVNNTVAGTVNVFLGALYSGLAISPTHTGTFTAGQTGLYRIAIANPAFATTSGTVSVTDTLPAGLTATSLTGSGWTCVLDTLTCTRSDALSFASAYPDIMIAVNVAGSLPPSVVTNQASVSYAGVVNPASDPTTIVLLTTTVLAVSPNPATLGQAVTLTATMTAGASGTVLFSDGVTAVGTALVNSGQATLVTGLLASGLRSLTATYSGDATHASSRSATYAETVKAAVAVGFNPKTNYSTGIAPAGIALGDFNQDGKTDLVTANPSVNTVSVLLGKGDGSFFGHTDYPAGVSPSVVVVGDFNNDGKPDIAVSSQTSNGVSVLLGNGNGTFQAPRTYAATAWPSPLAAGDIKGDGITRLVIGNPSYDPLLVLSMNTDGTFHAENIVLNGSSSSVLALGDFNHDYKVDIVEGPGFDIYVFLGNGDGTFQPWVAPYTPGAYALAIADLNGDGKADIVTADSTSVDVLLGNGDGTFQSPLRQAIGTQSPALVCADIDGDGHLDVVAINTAGNLVSVLFGNGDGTLQPPINYPVGASPRGLVAADLNGDGATDLAIVNSQGSSVSILLGMAIPVLQVTSSHIDPFGQAQVGASYTLSVTNAGPTATAGLVTLSDTLPASLTATAASGVGWACTLSTLTCTRSDPLAAAASFPAVTISLNVAANAPASVTNQVSVSGGSAVPAAATDPTTISSGPPITIQTNPAGLQFNVDGGAAQVSPRTVYLMPGAHTIAVPTLQSGPAGTQYIFTGWSDSGAASHTILVGASAATYTAAFQTQYLLTTIPNPPQGGSVSPASGSYFDAGTSVVLSATPTAPYVFTSWSGDAAGTASPTAVTMNGPKSVTATFSVPGFTCDLNGDGVTNAADVQLVINEALGVVPAIHNLNHAGVVNVADIQKVINASLALGCPY